MQTMNESMRVSREMKLLFLQIMKQNTLTNEDAKALIKIFVENKLIASPTRIVFKRESDEELYKRMRANKKFIKEHPELAHLYKNQNTTPDDDDDDFFDDDDDEAK